jgi:ribosomal protein S18 acetylase RimI-like enzyme
MDIVEAAESHIAELFTLWAEFFDYHRDIDPYYERTEDARIHIEQRFREKIESPDGQVLAAVHEGRVIGYSLFWIAEGSPFVKQRRYGFICDLAVTSAHRGGGIGDNLLRQTLAWFRAKGIRRIAIYALVGNRGAIRFWERHGFKATMQCMERISDPKNKSVTGTEFPDPG